MTKMQAIVTLLFATLMASFMIDDPGSNDDRRLAPYRETIDKHVPGIPNGNRITLAQLAGMESGVKDYSQVPAFVEEFAPAP